MKSPVWFVVAALVAIAGFVGAYFYLMPRIGRAQARHQVEQRTGKACQRDQSGDNEP